MKSSGCRKKTERAYESEISRQSVSQRTRPIGNCQSCSMQRKGTLNSITLSELIASMDPKRRRTLWYGGPTVRVTQAAGKLYAASAAKQYAHGRTDTSSGRVWKAQICARSITLVQQGVAGVITWGVLLLCRACWHLRQADDFSAWTRSELVV